MVENELDLFYTRGFYRRPVSIYCFTRGFGRGLVTLPPPPCLRVTVAPSSFVGTEGVEAKEGPTVLRLQSGVIKYLKPFLLYLSLPDPGGCVNKKRSHTRSRIALQELTVRVMSSLLVPSLGRSLDPLPSVGVVFSSRETEVDTKPGVGVRSIWKTPSPVSLRRKGFGFFH